MPTPDEIKRWRAKFIGLTTDYNVLDADRAESLLQMLRQGREAGYVDDVFINKYESFRNERRNKVLSTTLLNPQTGQPFVTGDKYGNARAVTGRDLFVGNKFMPELGPQGVAQARKERYGQIIPELEASTKRTQAVADVFQGINPSDANNVFEFLKRTAAGTGIAAQAVGGAAWDAGRQVLAGTPGIGGFITPPTPEQYAARYVPVSPEKLGELTPEQARFESMKAAAVGGSVFGYGAFPTLAGAIGGPLAVAAGTVAGVTSGPAGFVTIPALAAGGSYLLASGAQKLQEASMRRAYGDEVYDEQIRPLMDKAQSENPLAAFAGNLGNILLQGAPQVTSGIGLRRMGKLFQGAVSGRGAILEGTADELGKFGFTKDAAEEVIAASQVSDIVDIAQAPLRIARSPANKYEQLVGRMLGNVEDASNVAASKFAAFAPTSTTRMGRLGELSKFISDTPGASQFFGDVLGEQFTNLGQSAFDYMQALERSKRTGEPVNTAEMLANLAFGSIFIGNTKFTDAVNRAAGTVSRVSGDIAENVPGIGAVVKATRGRYAERVTNMELSAMRSALRQRIESGQPTEIETALGVRKQIGTAGAAPSPAAEAVAPGEVRVAVGNGVVVTFDPQTGTSRQDAHSDVYGGIDTTSAEQGAVIAKSLGELPTERVGRNPIDRLKVFGGQDAVVSVNGQQIVGVSQRQNEGYVIVRETSKDADGKPKVRFDILRVEDLEDGNQEPAREMLERANLQEATTPLLPEGEELVDLFGEIREFQKIVIENRPDLAAQFPTMVRLGEGDFFNGRIVGVEDNGDVRIQLMTPGMDIIRTPIQNIVGGQGFTTATQQLEPVAFSDMLNEQELNNQMVPKPDPGTTYNYNKDPDSGLHTFDINGQKFNVALTADQQSLIPELRQQIQDEIDKETRASGDQKKIAAAGLKALREGLKKMFGNIGRPESQIEWEVGEVVRVQTKAGKEYGVVLDNTDMGPLVALQSQDLKPIVVQDSDVLTAGRPREKRAGEEAAPPAGPINERVLSSLDRLEEILTNPALSPEERSVAIGEATTVLFNAVSDARKEFQDPDDKGTDSYFPSFKNEFKGTENAYRVTMTKIFSRLYGFPIEGTSIVIKDPGDKAKIIDLIQSQIEVLRNAERSLVDGVGTPGGDTVGELNKVAFELGDLKRAVETQIRFAASLKEGSLKDKTVEEYANIDLSDVADKLRGLPVADKVKLLIGQLQRSLDEINTAPTGADPFRTEVMRLLGITEDEGYFSSTRDASIRQLDSFEQMLRDAGTDKDASPELVDQIQDIINTDIFDLLRKSVEEMNFGKKPQPKVEKPKPSATATGAPVGKSIDESGQYTLSESLISEARGYRNRVDKGRFIAGQLLKLLSGRVSGVDVLVEVFGLTKSLRDADTWIGSLAKVRQIEAELRNALDRARNGESDTSPENLAKYQEAVRLLTEAVNDIDKRHGQDFKFKKSEKPLEGVETGQAQELAQRPEASKERRVTLRQARAFRGQLGAYTTNADGKRVKLFKNRRNLTQVIAAKLFADPNATLTSEEQAVFDALEFPDPKGNETWYRNAVQGISFINKSRQLGGLLTDLSSALMGRKGRPKVDEEIANSPGKAPIQLTDPQKQLLRDSGYVLPDGTIDIDGIRVYGGGERGFYVGSLFQSTGTPTPAAQGDIDYQEVGDVWSLNYEGQLINFRADQVKTRSQLQNALLKAYRKTVEGQRDGEKKATDRIKAVVDLFDTIVHGAAKRRVEMMLDATDRGAFVARQKGNVFIDSTRDQRFKIEVDSVLEGELRPLYERLRELLDLKPTVSLRDQLSSTNAETKAKVAVAIATLVEEETANFYAERSPAVADFDSIPPIEGALAQYLSIYDEDHQVAASVIMAFHAADASSFVHEMAHALFEGFSEPMAAELSSTLGHTLRSPTISHASVITYEAQEKFAYGLELSLANVADLNDPTKWKGTNLGQNRGASSKLFSVLKAAGDVVVSAYNTLARSHQSLAKPGERVREWRISYTARGKNGEPQNPNGRLFLWNGAPVILHDGRYATVRERFGTTKNGSRLVEVQFAGSNEIVEIENWDIAAIGAPLGGLNSSTMQVLSIWISERHKRPGLVQSTPAGRAEALRRDDQGRIIGVVSSQQFVPSGDITNENIESLLLSLDLQTTSDMVLDVLRKHLSQEQLKNLVSDIIKLNRLPASTKLKQLFERADLLTMLHAYADARIQGKLKRALAELNPGDARYKRAQGALAAANDATRQHPRMGDYWKAVRAAERVIYATRQIVNQTRNEINQIANGKNQNWTLDSVNQKSGVVVLSHRIRKPNRPKEFFLQKISVNMNNGAVTLLSGPKIKSQTVQDLLIEQDVIDNSPWFQATFDTKQRISGGTIESINAEATAAFEEIGIGKFGLRVPTKEFLIAKALVEQAGREGRETVPVGDFILNQVATTFADDAPTPMAQFGIPTLNRVVSPSLTSPDVIDEVGEDVVEVAMRLGDVAASMQSTGQIITTMNELARAAQDAWVSNTLSTLGGKAFDILKDTIEKAIKDNPDNPPKVYIYDAYITMPLSDAETGEPIYLTGIELEQALARRKAGDEGTPVRTGRVKAQLLSIEPLKGLGRPMQISYQESDKVSSEDLDDPVVETVTRLDVGEYWVDTETEKVVADFNKEERNAEFENLSKNITETLASTNNRVRDIAKKWPNQYNPATEGQSAIDPNQAWKPMALSMEIKQTSTKLADGRKVSVIIPYPKVGAESYSLDVTAGDSAWVAAKPLARLKYKQGDKELDFVPYGVAQKVVDQLLVDEYESYRTSGVAQHPYILAVHSIVGNNKTYKYSIAFRTDGLDTVVETDDNNGKGYATEKEAIAEAEKEHLRLRGLMRVKQEEELARRISDEFIDIINVVKGIGNKKKEDLTPEEINAVNILKQFTWYKAMEDRLAGTYGSFASYMADLLGATSPQTPVWQNYYATMYAMHGKVGTYYRRVALTPEIVERNANLAKLFTTNGKFDAKGAMVVMPADHRRLLRIWRLHAGLIDKFGSGASKSLSPTPVDLSINNYKQVMADVFSADGGTGDLKSWVDLFHEEVPDERQRAAVLKQFADYLYKDNNKKDAQFRSFVSVVDDWNAPQGEVVRYNGKRKFDEVIGKIPAKTKLPLAQTIVPRNFVSGALFGSNSQNVVQALANEWLTVVEGMPAKARNFAMNMVGLSKGATIDVWAARLTRRHLNEYFMGVRSRRVRGEDGKMRWVTEIVDEAKYENWLRLPESERKQFFRLAPSQERAVQGGYAVNLVDAVATNGYFTGDKDADVELLPPTADTVDVRNAKISGEFGAANRIFADASKKVNSYLGREGYMSPADLQAVVWFAEKELWVQNGWTTAAGAGGSFEQMYAEFVERSGGLARGTASIRLRSGGMNLTNQEKQNILDLLLAPFQRERKYQKGVGDVQSLYQYPEQKEVVLETPRYPALTANVLSRKAFNESVEAQATGQVSISAMMVQGRDAFDESYVGDIPTVGIANDMVGRIAPLLSQGQPIEIPLSGKSEKEAESIKRDFFSRSKDQRTVFVTEYDGVVRFVGSAVIQNIELVGEPGNQSLRLVFRKEQQFVNSAVFMHGKGGLDKDNSFGQKPNATHLKKWASVLRPLAEGIKDSGYFLGQVPVDGIPKSNGAVKDTVLPRQPRVASVQRASMVPIVEAGLNVLASFRDAVDAFVTRVATVTADNRSDYRGAEIGRVPGPDAYHDVRERAPESNLRYGFSLLLDTPVGAQRTNQVQSAEIFNRIEKVVTRLINELPNYGYTMRIEGHASDIYSDITGVKGAPTIEVVWSPEQFLRDYATIGAIDGQSPKNAEEYSKIFAAYMSGDIEAMRDYERKFANAARELIDSIQSNPETKGGIVLLNETVYDAITIPKELLNGRQGTIREIAESEHDRQWNQQAGLAETVIRYAELTGRTSDAEFADTLYVGRETERIASAVEVLDDAGGFGLDSVDAPTRMAQAEPFRPLIGLGRREASRINLVSSALAGNSRLGFDVVYQSALDDYRKGRHSSFQQKMKFIAGIAGETFENAFSDMDVQWHMDTSASVIAGDAKPSILATMFVKEDDFARVVGRAVHTAKVLAQSNLFIIEPSKGEQFGLNTDGYMVVPSIKIALNKPLDAVDLRTLVDSNPSVLNGVNLSSDGMTMDVFMVPDGNFGRAEAKQWTSLAKQSLTDFFGQDVSQSVVEPNQISDVFANESGVDKRGRQQEYNGQVSAIAEEPVRLWNFGSSELGGQGAFVKYEAVLDLVRTLAPDDSIPSPEKVTFRTNERLVREVESILSVITGKPITLPKRIRFRRSPGHTAFQQQLANHRDEMPYNALDSDPYVRKAYDELIVELGQQMQALNLKIEFMPYLYDADGKIVMDASGFPEFADPYKAVSENAIRDMTEERHLYVYPTTPSSFGEDPEDFKNHPLAKPSPFKTVDKKVMLWNDVLRAVHDAIAHGAYGASFGKDGEEMAFVTHALITQSPWAIMALNNETRMQNSWYHFNSTRVDVNGQPIPGATERFADQKTSLPCLEACYTGLNQVDDRLRLFASQLREEYDGYNGSVEYLARKEGGERRTYSFSGLTDAFSAFGDKSVVVNTKKHGDTVVLDLKNGVIEADLGKYGEDLVMGKDMVSTVFSSTNLTGRQAAQEFADDTPTRMAQMVGPAPQTQRPRPNVLLRTLFFANQLLRGGAAGDISPMLMQNFMNANLLENPHLVMRQLRLAGQVLTNPNLGFQGKDGTVYNQQSMRGRKMFDEVLETEVRGLQHYNEAKNAGLNLAAIQREKDLDQLRQDTGNPRLTYENLDELGYDTDIMTEAQLLKHMPGQGMSERFFTLSKDVVKANAFESMVNTLIDLGYNPTPWTYDANGNLIQTPWTRAMQDLAALVNISSGDVRFADADETDEMIGRIGKLMMYAPRWAASRMLLTETGRSMLKLGDVFGPRAKAYREKFLAINRMSPDRLKRRDPAINAIHARMMYKAWLAWLAMVLGVYATRLTNPHTMEVSAEDMLTRFKIGNYSVRPPGGFMLPLEMAMATVDALTLRPVKPGGKPKTNGQMMWEAVGKLFLTRASPAVSLAGEILTGRDAFGEPAFVPDSAADRYYREVLKPMFKGLGMAPPEDMKINRAISKRMMWWWLSDMMKAYETDRSAYVKQSEALIRSATIGAITAAGGRVQYFPRNQMWKRDAAKRLEAPLSFDKLFTGTEPTPIDMGAYDADPGEGGPDPVPDFFIGTVGAYDEGF